VADGLRKGSIRLDFKGRDVVGALQLGSSTHRCGTWGGPDSKAEFVDPVFTGPGMLELSAGSPVACGTEQEPEAPRRTRGRASSRLHASRR
jgi:hypothetical protein